jgi:phenylpropionate dioxygenase-like ring-hydroxylating dioxygenase large terminal subunit
MSSSVDNVGRAYGRTKATPDEAIIHCGPATRGGELLRRYWQPVALSRDATNLPKLVKLLDEELILYRSKSGTPGLLYPRCMHRGTNLLYGKVEDQGIRCCYHGWLFDERGQCLEMPCEPNNPGRQNIRQPWYPLVEKFGLLFAFMGPPDKQPVFPHFSLEDDLSPDDRIVSYGSESGPNGPPTGPLKKMAAWADYNWWQMFDNFMDAFHVPVLHFMINGTQFQDSLSVMPEVKFEATPDGVISIQHRKLVDGRIHQRISQVILPNMNSTAGVTDDDLSRAGISWTVPVDDSHYRTFGISRINRKINTAVDYSKLGMFREDWGPEHGKPFKEWSLEDHQRWQTDYTAQKGQGDISLHSEEHLTRIDGGVSMMRRLFRQEAEAVEKGRDPIGVSFDEPYVVNVLGANAILDPVSMKPVEGYDWR